MSTKIYCAYRLRRGVNLWEFVQDVRRKARKNIKTKLKKIYHEIAASVRLDNEEFQEILKCNGGDEVYSRLYYAMRYCKTEFRKNYASWERDYFDFTAYLRVFEHKKRYYFIPGVDSAFSGVLDFLTRDDRLEDFSYWNNSDCQLETMSIREWHYRRDIWNAIHDKGWVSLDLTICDYFCFHEVDPWIDICRNLRQEKEREDKKSLDKEKKR